MFTTAASTYRSASRAWAIHLAGATAALLVAVAFYQGVYTPWRGDISRCGLRTAELHRLLATGDEVTAELDSLSARLAELREAATRTRRRMPTQVETSRFVEQLTTAATSLGLRIVQCGAGAEERRDDYSKVEVNCKLAGSYASICRLLAAVDQFPQISKVSRLEIEAAPDSLAYPAQITFQLYYRRDSHDKEVKQGM